MQRSPIVHLSLLLTIVISLFISAISIWNATVAVQGQLEDIENAIAEDTIDQRDTQLRIEIGLEEDLDTQEGIEQIRLGEVIQAEDILLKRDTPEEKIIS